MIKMKKGWLAREVSHIHSSGIFIHDFPFLESWPTQSPAPIQHKYPSFPACHLNFSILFPLKDQIIATLFAFFTLSSTKVFYI